MKVYIAQIGEWDDVLEMRVFEKENDAWKYANNKVSDMKQKNPENYKYSLWCDVEGPFEVE